MGDVERRIVEQHERGRLLRECRATERWQETAGEMGAVAHGYYGAVDEAMAVAAEIAVERVVEGLVATIKALPALEKGTSIGTNYYADADFVRLADVLAVVEAAREDTT